jgi:hypothetical protein
MAGPSQVPRDLGITGVALEHSIGIDWPRRRQSQSSGLQLTWGFQRVRPSANFWSSGLTLLGAVRHGMATLEFYY